MNNTRALVPGEQFQEGELWRSPRGTLYRVITLMPEPSTLRRTRRRLAVLRQGPDGAGRKIIRAWDAVEGWARQPQPVETGGATERALHDSRKA